MKASPFVFVLLPILLSCSAKKLTDRVDPFIGTGGHGHTFPGPTRPFGMVQLGPDTRLDGWDGCSGYHYSDSIIYGFSHTHLSGTGVSDYGDVLLMPLSGNDAWNNGADGNQGYNSSFSKKTERAKPGYYEVFLDKPKVKAELTTTTRIGFHRYTFDNPADRKLIIDLAHRDQVLSSALTQSDEFTLSGHRHSSAWALDQRVFFELKANTAIVSADIRPDEKGTKAIIDFGAGDKEILIKVSLSSVDNEGARKNMEAELPHWDFDKTVQESEKAWEKQLGKIKVEGGTDKQQRIFYTALYHTMIAPNTFMDVDRRYFGLDKEIHQADDFTNYTVFSLWDTYRSTHPLYTLIEQQRTNDFIKTFLNHYKHGGRLPVWELAGNETNCMIGYHAVPVIADAYAKGIRDYDVNLALDAMHQSAQQNVLGIDHFRSSGYIPSEQEAESVSKTLEYAYDNWAIAMMADSLHRHELDDSYYESAQYYKNVFDPTTGFMRARNNNQWFAPFRPEEVNFHYTEANAWQYSYYVPQDLTGWMQLLGGEKALEQKLDDLFAADSKTSGREQADITGLIGQYAHGNEPSHHIPYLYNFAGAPHKTQKLVRQIMDELYDDQPDGLSGNEDCGQMSAWLVFSAMGFYPVTPGTTQYIMGSPWFNKVTIHLENGKDFIIEAKNQSKANVYVQHVHLNDQDYTKSYIDHRDIMKGGLLNLEMGDQPNTDWGTAINNRPSTVITTNEVVAIPGVLAGERAFLRSTEITLTCATQGADIYYRFDEKSEGIKFTAPITIDSDKTLYAWAEKNSTKSKVGISSFFKIPENRTISLATKYANHYTAGGDLALIDFLSGAADFRAGGWQGYEGVDIHATVELEKTRPIKELAIRFLQDENAWIFMPLEVEFFTSKDGVTFTSVDKVMNDISYKQKGSLTKTFTITTNQQAKYIRVIARNRGVCPPDHKGAGGKSWIFADEIFVK
jgi:predicted alpha-1,2-mannosidase